MNEEQIIIRAQREVAARHAAAQQHRQVVWRWLLPGFVIVVIVSFFAAPGDLPSKLLLAMSGVCALRPDHSYFAGDTQLPLESRMLGIYGGFLLGLRVLLAAGRLGAQRVGNRVVLLTLVVLFGSMVFDGINSTLADVGMPHLYTPTNLLRLLTGLFSGIALAPVFLWLVAAVALPRTSRSRRDVLRSPAQLLIPLIVGGLFALLVLAQHPLVYYPIALISVGGVVALLAGVALLGTLMVWEFDGRVRHLQQMVAPTSLALLLVFAALGAMAFVRVLIPSTVYAA